ncbi:MAG: hypothetical protein RIE73_05130 [Coleofasciculus sp. C1-SOL-03]
MTTEYALFRDSFQAIANPIHNFAVAPPQGTKQHNNLLYRVIL